MKDFDGKVRVPGADDPKNPMEVLKVQYENFSNLIFFKLFITK